MYIYLYSYIHLSQILFVTKIKKWHIKHITIVYISFVEIYIISVYIVSNTKMRNQYQGPNFSLSIGGTM